MTPSLSIQPRLATSARTENAFGRPARRATPPDPGPAVAPDLAEAADLYYRKVPRGLAYRHFDSAGAAILFVRDHLTAPQVASSVMQVGESRYEGDAVAAMVRLLGPGQASARPFDA